MKEKQHVFLQDRSKWLAGAILAQGADQPPLAMMRFFDFWSLWCAVSLCDVSAPVGRHAHGDDHGSPTALRATGRGLGQFRPGGWRSGAGHAPSGSAPQPCCLSGAGASSTTRWTVPECGAGLLCGIGVQLGEAHSAHQARSGGD